MSMFRSPNDISSSSDPESSSDDGSTKGEHVGVPLQTLESASESIQGDLAPPTPPTWTQDLTPDGHATLMLASLLQNECRFQAAETLNKQPSTTHFTRDSPEAQQLGDQMYKLTSQELAARGVIAEGVEHGEWDSTRTVYRDLMSSRLQTSLEASSRGLLSDSPDMNLPPTSQDRTSAAPPIVSHLTARGAESMVLDVPQDQELQQLPSFVNLHLQSPQMNSPVQDLFGTPKRLAPPTASRLAFLQRQASGLQTIIPPPRVINRYQSDFKEGKLLGKGGYGVVHHVVNLVDGQDYAIKRIPLSAKRLKSLRDNGKEELEKILKEIRTLARLEHSNIVRYYTAWIQQTEIFPRTPRQEPPRLLLHDSPGRRADNIGDRTMDASSDQDQSNLGGAIFGRKMGSVSTEVRSARLSSEDAVVFEDATCPSRKPGHNYLGPIA